MKNSVLNLMSIKLTLISFMFTGMFLFGSAQLHAQNSLTTAVGFSAPKVTYVSSAIAISRVEAKIDALKTQLANYSPGSQSYNEIFMKYTFYNIILDRLNEGKSVKESLQAGLDFLGTDNAGTAGNAVIQATRQEATNLLKA